MGQEIPADFSFLSCWKHVCLKIASLYLIIIAAHFKAGPIVSDVLGSSNLAARRNSKDLSGPDGEQPTVRRWQ